MELYRDLRKTIQRRCVCYSTTTRNLGPCHLIISPTRSLPCACSCYSNTSEHFDAARLKGTFFNFGPESAVTRHIFSKTWDSQTLRTLQILARHRKKQFSMTIRIQKIQILKHFQIWEIFVWKYFWNFWAFFFRGNFGQKIKILEIYFLWKKFDFRILKNFEFCPIFSKFSRPFLFKNIFQTKIFHV